MRDTAQRFDTFAPRGALLKSTALIRPQPAPIGDDAYLKLIRQLPCVRCGLEPCGEAAHVRLSSAAFNKRRHGMGLKPEARWCVPLCSSCHTRDPDALHRVGEYLFWHEVGISPFLLCDRLYAKRGDFPAMRAIVQLAMAERG